MRELTAMTPLVSFVDRGLEAGLGAVKGGIAGLAEVETVVLVIADGEVALIGASGRRRVDEPVAGIKDVRHPLFDRVVAALEVLKDGGGGDIVGSSRRGKQGREQR